MEFALASSSQRRARLLRRLVRIFRTAPANRRERIGKNEALPSAARRLACEKAKAAAMRLPRCIVIGADTIAYLGRRNFRKTASAKRARSILRLLSGKTHSVATGVCVVFPGGRKVAYVEKARVRMRKLDGKLLEWYIRTGEWKGRAGSYDVSGRGKRLVLSVNGETETVAGLPLRRLRAVLAKAGLAGAKRK